MRGGITPTINALAVILIAVTLTGAAFVEFRRRQVDRKTALLAG